MSYSTELADLDPSPSPEPDHVVQAPGAVVEISDSSDEEEEEDSPWVTSQPHYRFTEAMGIERWSHNFYEVWRDTQARLATTLEEAETSKYTSNERQAWRNMVEAIFRAGNIIPLGHKRCRRI